MIVIPCESPGHSMDLLIVILGPENLDRMKKADPAEVLLGEQQRRPD